MEKNGLQSEISAELGWIANNAFKGLGWSHEVTEQTIGN